MGDVQDDNPKTGVVSRLVGLFYGVQQPKVGADGESNDAAVQQRQLPPGTASPERLQKLFAEVCTTPGDPYVAFMKIVKPLARTLKDSAASYVAALEVVKESAITADIILEEFGKRRERLATAAQYFNKQMEALAEEKIAKKLENLEGIRAAVAAKRAELATLEAELVSCGEEIKAEEGQLDSVAANFQAAHDQVLGEIDTDEKTFKTLLGLS